MLAVVVHGAKILQEDVAPLRTAAVEAVGHRRDALRVVGTPVRAAGADAGDEVHARQRVVVGAVPGLRPKNAGPFPPGSLVMHAVAVLLDRTPGVFDRSESQKRSTAAPPGIIPRHASSTQSARGDGRAKHAAGASAFGRQVVSRNHSSRSGSSPNPPPNAPRKSAESRPLLQDRPTDRRRGRLRDGRRPRRAVAIGPAGLSPHVGSPFVDAVAADFFEADPTSRRAWCPRRSRWASQQSASSASTSAAVVGRRPLSMGLPAEAFGVHVRGRRPVDGALAAREDARRVARHDRVPVRARGGLVRPRAAAAGLGGQGAPTAPRERRVVEALVHAALEVPERAVVARRPDAVAAVLVEVARPPRAVALAVAVPVAAVVLLAAVVVADGAPTVGLGRVLVVREAAVHVRRQI